MTKRNFSSFIEGFLEYSKNVESPEKFLRWSALSILAGAIGRKTWVLFNGELYIHPNEYIVLVGGTGVKKSTGASMASSLIHEVKDVRLMSTQMTAASLVTQLERAGKEQQLELGNETYGNASVFFYSSEAAATLKETKGGGSIITLLTDLYDCGHKGWSKTGWTKETISGGRIEIFNPCLNMLACSTPEWLVDSIGKQEIQGGFASRMLFVVQVGKSDRTIEWMDESDIEKNSHLKKKLVEDLTEISKLKGQFRVHKDVRDIVNKVKHQSERFVNACPDDLFVGYFNRKMWHTIKLAQLFALDRGDTLELHAQDAERAIEWLDSIEPTMRHAFGLTGTNDKAHNLHLLWEAMRTKTQLTRQELVKMSFRNCDEKTLNEFIKTLHDMGKIQLSLVGGKAIYVIADRASLL